MSEAFQREYLSTMFLYLPENEQRAIVNIAESYLSFEMADMCYQMAEEVLWTREAMDNRLRKYREECK